MLIVLTQVKNVRVFLEHFSSANEERPIVDVGGSL